MKKEFKFKLNGKDYITQVEEKDAGQLTVTVNGKAYDVEVPLEGKIAAPQLARPAMGGVAAASHPAAVASSVNENIEAPLPGTITAVNVKVGDKVKRGQVVVVMEAMKMANDIVANCDGTVTSVLAQPGQNVNQGDVLVAVHGDDAPADAPAPAAAPSPKPKAAPGSVQAPLPGTIKKILVQAGQKVKRGDVLLTMEAMKMENNICAEQDGLVKAVLVKSEQQVQQGDTLVDMDVE